MHEGFTTQTEDHRFMEIVAALVFGVLLVAGIAGVFLMVTFAITEVAR